VPISGTRQNIFFLKKIAECHGLALGKICFLKKKFAERLGLALGKISF